MADLTLRSGNGARLLKAQGANEAHSPRFSVYLFGRLWSVDGEAATTADRVLQAIERNGPAAFTTLDGEWGLVVEDKERGDVHIVANPVGSVPFYHAESGGKIIVTTSLGQLVQEAGLSIDALGARRFLAKAKKGGIAPLFSGATRLMGREFIRIDRAGKVEKGHYFDWPIEEDQPFDAQDLKKRILEPIDLVARPPLLPAAVAFSSGMDSSVIAAVMRKTDGLRCYSIDAGPEADNEEADIDATCRLWNLDHQYVPATTSLTDLLAVVGESFEPVYEVVTMTTLISIVRRAVGEGRRQLLVGLGPDMVLAGAQQLILPYLATLMRRRHLPALLQDSIKLGAYSRRGTINLWKRLLAGGEDAQLAPLRHDYPEHVREPDVPGLEARVNLDIKPTIARMLSGVAISSELRAVERLWGMPLVSPLYSIHLARYCLSRDPRHLMRGGRYKSMMRQALADLLPHHLITPKIKKKIPTRPNRHMVFDPVCQEGVEARLDGSGLLRDVLLPDPVGRFRASRDRQADADFWLRCLQLSELERAAEAGVMPAEGMRRQASLKRA